MDCRQFLKEWQNVDSEQFTADQNEHLENCGECRSKVEAYREFLALLKARSVTTSAERFTGSVMNRINHAQPIRHSNRKIYVSSAAAAFLALITVGLFLYQESEAKNAEIASMFTSVYSYKNSPTTENTYTELEMMDYILDEFE